MNNVKEFSTTPITSRVQARSFFAHLHHDIDLSFHPDDPFVLDDGSCGYVDEQGADVFDPETSALYQLRMNEACDVLPDPSAVGLESLAQYRRMRDEGMAPAWLIRQHYSMPARVMEPLGPIPQMTYWRVQCGSLDNNGCWDYVSTVADAEYIARCNGCEIVGELPV